MLGIGRKINNQLGDTIIEVMIVLSILGLAISISYATANRSLLNARQAQENSQATELVQSQAEQLRAMSANDSTDTTHYIYTNQPFCITGNGAGAQVTTLPSTACNLGEANRYGVKITWSGTTTDTFTILATWDDVTGQSSDTVTLTYRVHPPAPAAGAPAPIPPPPTCQYGGVYPNCTTPNCTLPQTGNYPDCGTCQYGGVYPNCVAPPQLNMSIASKSCGRTINPVTGLGEYTATLNITGTPGDTAGITQTYQLLSDGFNLGSYATVANVLIGPNGTTVGITIGVWPSSFSVTWQAAASDGDQDSVVQICP